jgi:hypothetical protein
LPAMQESFGFAGRTLGDATSIASDYMDSDW